MPKIFAVIVLVLAGCFPFSAATAESLTVFAAASMKDAMDRAVPAFESASGVEVVVSFAASSILARQIAAGAPADIFISADMNWMDWLAKRALVRPESARTIAANALVIVSSYAPADRAGNPAGLLRQGRFAMGDPRHVPAGRYAKAALESLGLWEEVRERAVYAENVRVALELARRGEVPAAIVYASDEEAVQGLSRAYTFPPESHPPIIYLAAATVAARPRAQGLIDFLAGQDGQAILGELGFASP